MVTQTANTVILRFSSNNLNLKSIKNCPRLKQSKCIMTTSMYGASSYSIKMENRPNFTLAVILTRPGAIFALNESSYRRENT